MTNCFSVYRSPYRDPYIHLAAEEYLTRTVKKGEPILFLWQNRETVVIGKNQCSASECALSLMKRDGVLLSRRLSGGGAVFHDEGNLCFSLIAHPDDHDVKRNLSLLSAACREFGITALPNGRNDVCINGRKFSGNAFYSVSRNQCHHGTVLISASLTRLSRYLTVSKEKLEAKGIKSVSSRVVNLSSLSEEITPHSFGEAMIRCIPAVFGIPAVLRPFPDIDLYRERAEELAADEWLLGENPEFTTALNLQTTEGLLDLRIKVKAGRIVDLVVYTDALAVSLPSDVIATLRGIPYDEEKILHILKHIITRHTGVPHFSAECPAATERRPS
jgi:lipoate-protein ligase A